MVLLASFTRIRSTEGSSADCSLFILSLHALALHQAVKILPKIFLYDWARWHTCICQLYFPPECQQDPALCSINTIKSENIPNIWHKSSTKHKEVWTSWNDKNDNANYTPSYHIEVLPMAQVAIFKEIFDQVRKDLDCEFVLFWTKKRHNAINYIYYLATDNIHIVLENDNTVLIKDLKRLPNVKFSRNTHLIETSYDRLKSREIHFSNTGKILLKQGFRWSSYP